MISRISFTTLLRWVHADHAVLSRTTAKRQYVRVITIGVLMLCPIIKAAATSVVIRRTPFAITVGADSRHTRITLQNIVGFPTTHIDATTVCKIYQADYVTFFAVTGWDIEGVDKNTLALESCKKGRTLSEKINIFAEAVQPPLIAMLGRVRQANASYYDQVFRSSGDPVLQIAIFGLENGIPAYITLSLNVVYESSMDWKPIDLYRFSEPRLPSLNPLPPPPIKLASTVDGCPLNHSPKDSIMHPLGISTVIDKLKIDEGFWECRGDVAGVRFLIMIQCAAASQFVSEPIDILRIDRQGKIEWNHKPDCAEVQTPPRKRR